MTEAAPARRGISPELRATAFYITMYLTSAVGAAYAGIWFAEKGLSPGEIGIINAVPVFAMLVINLVVGRVADKSDDWRGVIVIGAVVAGFVPLGLFFAEGFWALLIVWSLSAIPIMAVGPVLDAATLRMTRRNGTNFGVIRAWGTMGYTAAIALTGSVAVWFGGGSFVILFAGFAVLRALVSLSLPRFRATREDGGVDPVKGAVHLIEVMKPWFLLPLIGWAIVYAAHWVLDAFQALLWKEQGIAADVIGWLIALGALAEAGMMFVFQRFAGRFKGRHLILVAAIVSVLRWIAMAYSPPVPVLIALQCLHAVTYGLGFMGCVHFIANWTSEKIAAEAQSFSVVLQQGMSVLAVAGFGWLVGLMGAQAYFAVAAFTAVGVVLIWISIRQQPPKQM